MADPPQRWPSFVGTKECLIWLGVSALLLAIGLMKSINLLALVAYLSFAFQFVNALLAWRMVRKVRATRRSPPPVFAGETAAILGAVENTSSGRAVLTLCEVGTTMPRSWFLPALPGGVTLPFTAPLDFDRRGNHPLPSVQAVSAYPFGLITWRRTVTGGERAVVLPALGSLDLSKFRRWLQRLTAMGENQRRVIRRAAPTEGDVRGVRPYRPGDSPRDVHWKTSARRGSLVVREYDRTAPTELLLLVEPWMPPGPIDRTSEANLEWVLSLAVSIAWAWVNADSPGGVTLVLGGASWNSVAGPGTPAFVRTGFVALADCRGVSAIPPIPGTVLRGASRAARVVLSTRANSPVPAQLQALGAGVAFAEPGTALPWYTPPVARHA